MDSPRDAEARSVNTFTKFDQLGAVLTELSFDHVMLQFSRFSTNRAGWAVYLHQGDECFSGGGDGECTSPSQALEEALQRCATKQAARVETAAAQECAA